MLKFLIIPSLFFSVFLILFLPVVNAATIVVSIPPLASALKPLLSENDKIVVLLPANQSPHHFSLKPSHLIEIAKADLLISVGVGVDDWAGKAFANQQLRNKTPHIIFAQVEGVTLLSRSKKGGSHSHHHHAHNHGTANYDPHLWLDLDNIKALLETVSKTDLAVSKEKLANELKKLSQLDEENKRILEPVQQVAFLIEHPAFNYFEKKYQLNNVGSIELNESGTSLKHMIKLQQKIETENVRCIFKSAHTSSKKVATLLGSNNTAINIETLNPMGSKDLVTTQVFTNLVQQYLRCLQ